MRLAVVLAIFTLILVVVGINARPKSVYYDGGMYDCYGLVFTTSYDEIELNVKDSVLRKVEKQRHHCTGRIENRIIACIEIYHDVRQIDTAQVANKCSGDSSAYGISCKEWSRALSELKTKKATKIQIQDAAKTGVHVVCEYEYESFPGGDSALTAFVNKHFQFPDSIKGNCIGGFLNTIFAINSAGGVENVRVHESSVVPYYAGEIRRVLLMMPKWKPKSCRGVNFPAARGFRVDFKNTDSSCKGMGVTLTRYR